MKVLTGGENKMMFKNTPNSQGSAGAEKSKKIPGLPKIGWKIKTTFAALAILLLIAGTVQTVITIGAFFDTYKIVRHTVIELKINPPFTIEERELISPITPEATSSAKVEEPKEQTFNIVSVVHAQESVASETDYKHIASFIRMRESSNGKPTNDRTALHNKCAAKGMTNEYGYNPQAVHCFPDEATAQNKIVSWFQEKTETMTLATALCFYNTGTKLSDCKYYQDYLAFTLK